MRIVSASGNPLQAKPTKEVTAKRKIPHSRSANGGFLFQFILLILIVEGSFIVSFEALA